MQHECTHNSIKMEGVTHILWNQALHKSTWDTCQKYLFHSKVDMSQELEIPEEHFVIILLIRIMERIS